MSNCKVNLSAPTGAVEIRLRDANLNVVASGLGSLKTEIKPGIYQLQYRAGDRLEQSLIALRPGQEFENHKIDLPFATPMPVEGTSTSRETYRQAVEHLSRQPDTSRGGYAQLMLFVRNMDKVDSASASERIRSRHPMKLGAELVQDWRLRAADGAVVPVFESALQVEHEKEWLGFSVTLPSGGYVLETLRDSMVFGQSIWLSDGWVTGLFVPNSEIGPLPERASVQMSRRGMGWMGWEPESQQLARMSELALISLREQRVVISPESILNLLHGKFQNPMFGIIGAHTLLLNKQVQPALLQEVLGNLINLVPGHPDVLALQKMAVLTGVPLPPTASVTWPPMLASSFRGLLVADAKDDTAIASGSAAETFSPFMVQRGTWTAWYVEAASDSPEPKTSLAHGSFKPLWHQLSGIEVSELFPGELSPSDRVAWQRVLRYLNEFAAMNSTRSVDDALRALKDPQLGAQLGLPQGIFQRLRAFAREHLQVGWHLPSLETPELQIREEDQPPEQPPLTGATP